VPYESAFEGSDQRLMGAARSRVFNIYKKQALKLADGIDLPEDHLSFMCQFMAVMAKRAIDFKKEGNAEELHRNLLLQQERRGKIPAGLPSGTKCGNKTGELNYAENDAAIIWGPACDYVLVVFAGNISAPGTAQSQIRHLSTTVYEGMNNMGSGRQDAYAADTAATAAEAAADAASTGETASD
jgi:hypothetical protein